MRFKLSVLLNAPLLPFWPLRGIANREFNVDMIKDEIEVGAFTFKLFKSNLSLKRVRYSFRIVILAL